VNKNDLKPINLNIFKNGVGFNIENAELLERSP
jgi:hypothetical protein